MEMMLFLLKIMNESLKEDVVSDVEIIPIEDDGS